VPISVDDAGLGLGCRRAELIADNLHRAKRRHSHGTPDDHEHQHGVGSHRVRRVLDASLGIPLAGSTRDGGLELKCTVWGTHRLPGISGCRCGTTGRDSVSEGIQRGVHGSRSARRLAAERALLLQRPCATQLAGEWHPSRRRGVATIASPGVRLSRSLAFNLFACGAFFYLVAISNEDAARFRSMVAEPTTSPTPHPETTADALVSMDGDRW